MATAYTGRWGHSCLRRCAWVGLGLGMGLRLGLGLGLELGLGLGLELGFGLGLGLRRCASSFCLGSR